MHLWWRSRTIYLLVLVFGINTIHNKEPILIAETQRTVKRVRVVQRVKTWFNIQSALFTFAESMVGTLSTSILLGTSSIYNMQFQVRL